jgi:hypothetical protein
MMGACCPISSTSAHCKQEDAHARSQHFKCCLHVPLQVTPSAKRQDNSSSSSRAAQQDIKAKLRTDKLQAQLRQLQELRLTDAKVSQGQVARVLASPCVADRACKLLAIRSFILCLGCACLVC